MFISTSKRIVCLAMVIFFFNRCYIVHRKDLTLNKIPFVYSDLVRTDGYYFFKNSADNYIRAYAFCKNGYMHGGGGLVFRSHEQIEEVIYRAEIYDNIDTWSFYRLSGDSITIQGMTLTGSSEIMGEWNVYTEWGKADSGRIVISSSKRTGFKERKFIQTFEFRQTGKEMNCSNIRMIIKK